MPSQNDDSIERASSAAESSVLTINLINPFAIFVGQKQIELISRKTRALIGYLALAESQEESRDRLVGLLWSESNEERARASLRQALHEIRNGLHASAFDGFRTDRLTVALDRGQIRVDVIDVLNDAAGGRAHPCLLARQNPLDDILGEVETADPVFQTWVLAKRQTIRDQIIRQLENGLRAQAGIASEARELAVAINNLDQTHEEACRVLIRAFVADGEIGSALRIYKSLWDLLEEDYDVEPTQQTQDLIAEVKAALPFSGTGTSSMVAALPPRPNLSTGRSPLGKLVLAVGPFKLLGGESQRNYLVQGFRQELIGCLVRFREWLVRDAVQDSPPSGRDAANDEFFLDASGYESSDALHFVLTLRNGTTGTYLWSENLALTLERWHHLQQALVRRVATALNVHVSADRMHQITIRQDIDLKAHDIWLFGQATLLSFDQKKWDKAEALFRQVVQQTPAYAPAFSSLAQLNNSYHIVKPGIKRDPQRTQAALAYAREAVRLDPLDSRSQLCLGWSHAMAKQYEQAMIYIPLAHDLNDNDPWTLVSAANCYAFCGRHKQAVEIIDAVLLKNTALAPSPLQWAYHTAIRFIAGDYDGCLAAADFAGDLNPNVPGYKAAALYHLGRRAVARAELNHFFAIARNRWCAEEPATPEAITRWFLHMFPIALPEDWQRLREGMAGAGAPVEGLFHHQW